MNDNNLGYIILTVIIILVISVLIFFFIAKPQFNKYIEKKQVEAKDMTLSIILQSIQEVGYVDISDQQGNKIRLIPEQQGGNN